MIYFVGFAGLLFPNVPGIGPYWFLAWTCIFTSKFTESVIFHNVAHYLNFGNLSYAMASLRLEGFVTK